MKKLLILGILVLSMGLVIGCGNDDDSDDGDTGTGTGNPPGEFAENFDKYAVGDLIGAVGEAGYWGLWEGATQDMVITDTEALSKPNSAEVDNTCDTMLFFYYTSGAYDIGFALKVADGMQAYYNFQYDYTGDSAGIWAFQVFFFQGGVATVNIAGEDFSIEYDDSAGWIVVSHEIDLAKDTAKMYIDGELKHEFIWSAAAGGGGEGKIDGIDFYDYDDQPPGGHYYVDDVYVETL